MGINVALSVLESVAPLDPTVERVIEGILLIARAIMAVLYAYVIHSLHGEGGEPHDEPHAQPALQQAITDLQMNVEQRLAEISTEQSRMLASLQQVPPASPAIDYEAITEAVTRNLEARFEAALRQKTVISEAPEARQIEAAKPRHEAKHEARRRGRDASNIVTLRQASAGATDKRAAVYALLAAGDQRSSYQLAPIIGCSAATIQRYMRDWKTARAEASREATESAI